MDLGACPKSHTERLKTEFIAAKEANPSDPIFNRFQMEYEANIFAFVDECDRRIRAAHRRLEKTPEEKESLFLFSLPNPFSCIPPFIMHMSSYHKQANTPLAHSARVHQFPLPPRATIPPSTNIHTKNTAPMIQKAKAACHC